MRRGAAAAAHPARRRARAAGATSPLFPRVRDGTQKIAPRVERTWRDAVEGGRYRAFCQAEQVDEASHCQAQYRTARAEVSSSC